MEGWYQYYPFSSIMALNQIEQVLTAINKEEMFFIALPTKPSTDAVAAGLVLFHVLEKKKKRVKIVADHFSVPNHLSFLPKVSSIEPTLKASRQFIIDLNLTNKEIGELNYDIQNNRLKIFITPSKGFLQNSDVSFSSTDYNVGMIIVIDSPDLEHLGSVYEENTDFFYKVPIINIDHKTDNEQFGEVNLIDVKASSSSEIVYQIIQRLGDDILNQDIATILLTGIISKTRSFQLPTITPQILSAASRLLGQGARRDEIMDHLYHSKPLNTLKLWGRVLARLQGDRDRQIVWSLLQKDDFTKAHATEADLEGVIDELLVNLPEAQKIMVLYEGTDGLIHGIINTPHNIHALKLFHGFQPQGTADSTTVTISGKTIKDAEKLLLERLRTDSSQTPTTTDETEEQRGEDIKQPNFLQMVEGGKNE